MTRERLYIVHGMGNDAVGLVGSITTPIAQAGGNIVDLRQDVLHGLFTVFMVVDLGGCDLRIDAFTTMVKSISEDTGIRLQVDTYYPVARNPLKKEMLLILVGNDRPGIISSISQTLAKYRINIDFAQTIGREGVFLMELLTDISAASLPLDNLLTVLTGTMASMGMKTMVQTDDVFNKKKRVLLFDIASSFIPPDTFAEILKQTGITAGDVGAAYGGKDDIGRLAAAAALLEGFAAEAMSALASGIRPRPGTAELIQTLKIMGYKTGLVTGAFSPIADAAQKALGLDYCFGTGLVIDDDSKTVCGEIAADEIAARTTGSIVLNVAAAEGISAGDVTVLDDRGCAETPGIRIELDLELLLEFWNNRVMSRDNCIGILGSFGAPPLS